MYVEFAEPPRSGTIINMLSFIIFITFITLLWKWVQNISVEYYHYSNVILNSHQVWSSFVLDCGLETMHFDSLFF